MWLAAVALSVLAGLSVVDALESEPTQSVQPALSDTEMVWCDARLARVLLAGESLGLVPSDIAANEVAVPSSESSGAGIEDLLSNIELLSLLAEFEGLVTPVEFGELTLQVSSTDEGVDLLAARSVFAARSAMSSWLDEAGGWAAEDPSRACRAAFAAFGPG